MTTEKPLTPAVDKHFLAAMTPAATVGRSQEYDLAGVRWFSHSAVRGDCLSFHREGEQLEMIDIRAAYNAPGFAWDWVRKLAEGIYARASGKAETVEAAARAALDYAPTPITFRYLGESTWLEMRPDYWIAVIEGEEATIYRQSDGTYHWTRAWKAAAPVLAMIPSAPTIGGQRPSLAEAMQACIDAPELFKRACAAMVMEMTR